MVISVDLLLISHNRRDYLERTLNQLLNCSSSFRLFCWDNGSKDGASDIIASCNDERIVEKHFCPINVMQAYPTEWFLERSTSDIIGKIDDDTLAPQGWIETIGEAVQNNHELGMVGCWTFWPDDFERNRQKALKKIVRIGKHKILHNSHIGGSAFLMRKTRANDYFISHHNGRAFPIDRIKMTEDGFISGWYYPLLVAEHMDDPRSDYCLMNQPEGMNGQAALTAKVRGMTSPQQYQKWIMNDVDTILSASVVQQLKKIKRNNSFLFNQFGKIKKRFIKIGGTNA